MPKLNWEVQKNKDGSYVRRRLVGDELSIDYVDVQWTHTEGFPEDTQTVPKTHPPDIQYEMKKLPARKIIHDQLTVGPQITDSTISMMLDEKRVRLAKSLGISV
jgi:hypothetical protein